MPPGQSGSRGLGLTGIEPNLEGLIIIGRDSEVPPQAADLRRSICRSNRVRIETYDWLLSTARDRLEVLEQARIRHPGAGLLGAGCSGRCPRTRRGGRRGGLRGIFITASTTSVVQDTG